MPNPIDDEELYKGIELGGVLSPGSVTLSGHDSIVNWDVKVAKGQKGATTSLKDIPPRKFKAVFYLVKDDGQEIDDFADWPAFRAQIESTVSNPSSPKALDIYHPDLAAQDIKSVCKGNVLGTVHDGKGGQTITVEFQEYRPAKPQGGTPSGSKLKKPATTDPDAAALAELAALTKKYNDTPWGSPP